MCPRDDKESAEAVCMDSGVHTEGNKSKTKRGTLQKLYEMLWNSQILEIELGPN